jgi:hypothetical protein
MRHRSRPLQVSTFPFLAVLLCTMGSLILLLLVIDRRAKAIARAKAIHAAEQAGLDDAQALAAARAEFERRRAALHGALRRQEEELTAAINKTKAEEAAKSTEFQSEEARRREYEARLETELMQLRQEQMELEKHKADLAEKEQKNQPFNQELTELTRELLILEQTLASLKQARQHDQQHYSVVPYRGRFGESRKPVYLECRATSLVFHQGGPVLEDGTLSQAGIRSEVKRYFQARAASPTQSTLYLLLLIRPDGIGTYYRTMAALEGMPIEYGYELVDTDWVLDFPDNRNVGAQPSMTADVINRNSSGNGAAGILKTPGGFGRPQVGLPGQPVAGMDEPRGLARNARAGGVAGQFTGYARDGFPERSAPNVAPIPGVGSPLQLSAAGQSGVGGVSAVGVSGSRSESLGLNQQNLAPGFAPGRPASGELSLTPDGDFGRGSGPGASGGPVPTGSVGLNSVASAGAPPGIQAPLGSVSEGGPAGGPAVPPFAKPVGSGTSPASSTPNYARGPGGTRSGSASEVDPPGGTVVPPFATPAGTGTSPASSTPGYTQAAAGTRSGSASEISPTGGTAAPPFATAVGNGTSPASSTTSDAQTAVGTRSGSSGIGATPLSGALPTEHAQGTQSAGSGIQSLVAPEANKTPGGQPAPEGGAPSDGANDGRAFQDHALPPLSDPEGRAARNQQPPRRMFRRYGNLDWVISVECTGDALLLSPAGMRIPTAALRTGGGAENPLAGAVRELIGRRQASVPVGEPAYRPRIRFLVRPDGLRSYYEACAALEPLQLPMTRENVRRPAEKKTDGFDR